MAERKSSRAKSAALQVIRILERFLEELGLSLRDSLIDFGLAPLPTRRDIAMLGIIHRAVLRKGPKQLRELFALDAGRRRSARERHPRQVCDPYEMLHRDYINRSVLGYIGCTTYCLRL